MTNDNDIAARLNNEAAQRMAEGGSKPYGGAPVTAAGIKLTDTQIGGGHLADQQGLHGATINGLGSLFQRKNGPGIIEKAFQGMHKDLAEKAANTNAALKEAAAGLIGAGIVIGGSGAGSMEGPMPTPIVASNDRVSSSSLSA